MFTVQLTNHRFGYTSYYGSFADPTDARAAVGRIRRHTDLNASFDVVLLPVGVTPKPLHASFQGK